MEQIQQINQRQKTAAERYKFKFASVTDWGTEVQYVRKNQQGAV